MMMSSFVTHVYCKVCGFVQLYIYITYWQEQELSVMLLLQNKIASDNIIMI